MSFICISLYSLRCAASFCLSACLPCPFVPLSACPPISLLSLLFISLSLRVSVLSLFLGLSGSLCLFSAFCPSVSSPSVSLPLYLPVVPFLCLRISLPSLSCYCPFIPLSLYLLSLSFCLSIFLSPCFSVSLCIPVSLSPLCLFVSLSSSFPLHFYFSVPSVPLFSFLFC